MIVVTKRAEGERVAGPKDARAKAELLLHPVRLRIIQAFLGGRDGRRLTAQRLADALADVPPATLYRHLNALAAAGVLAVAAERRVRGAWEKVYALPGEGVRLAPEELARASRADQLHYFTTFVASLLGAFSRYLQRDRIDPLADGVGYRQLALYLSDAEFARLIAALEATVDAARDNTPAPDRRLRLFTTVILPADETPPDAGG